MVLAGKIPLIKYTKKTQQKTFLTGRLVDVFTPELAVGKVIS